MTRRVYIVPAAIAALAVAGVVGANYISVPTLTHTFDPGFTGEAAEVSIVVEGVRCYGMADYLREHIDEVPGLVSMVAYAGKHRVIIEYDPQTVSVAAIIEAIEAPIWEGEAEVSYFSVTAYENK